MTRSPSVRNRRISCCGAGAHVILVSSTESVRPEAAVGESIADCWAFHVLTCE
jgi:hypothetical protein